MNVSVDIKNNKKAANGPFREKVLSVHHWSKTLFSFKITRPESFRFRSGEFVMLGLEVDGKPLLRAYSVASPNWDDELEFYSIKVPDGPLTSRLQKIQPGDTVLLGKKPVGTLVLDAVKPGKNLYLLSTGTGFAPFASIIRDPETYDKFENIIVTHTCRSIEELDYSKTIVCGVMEHEFLGELAQNRLYFFDSVTREDYIRTGRITSLIKDEQLFRFLNMDAFNPESDRAMICGSKVMIDDTKALLEKAGMVEGANNSPADFVIEKAFVG